jgi:hypothetical protein
MDYKRVFDNYGIKSVSGTDVQKRAYVLDINQERALRAAGYQPSNGGGANSTTLPFLRPTNGGLEMLVGSFYLSIRKEKGRDPEPRVGRAAMRWMSPNDEVLIGNIGRNVYIGITSDLGLLSDSSSEADLRTRAEKSKGKPITVDRTVTEFFRDPFVVAAALRRADGVCEVPGCSHSLFVRETGTPYLEVHHILPLGQGGEDTMLNVAAICPACHREHHFGTRQTMRRDALLNHIQKLEASA